MSLMNLKEYGELIREKLTSTQDLNQVVNELIGHLSTVQTSFDYNAIEILQILTYTGLNTELLGIVGGWILNQERQTQYQQREPVVNTTRTRFGRESCKWCKNMAKYYNKQRIEIKMPLAHKYGKCPLYCKLCSQSGLMHCVDPQNHLIHKCILCDTDVSNHPTNECCYYTH